MKTKPLQGIRVLDLSRLLPGPYCSQLLLQLGAEVIRVEDATKPDGGDMMRGVAPGRTRPSRFFDIVNAGKRSVCVDLSQDGGRAYLHHLLEVSDVLIEGFRPGVMERFGLDGASLLQAHPRLVYCSISGFGQTGACAQSPSHDINYQALTGVLHQNAAQGERPVISGFQAGDLAGGSMMALSLILAALLQAQRTGQGQVIDLSMTHALGQLQPMMAFECMDYGQASPAGGGMVTGGIAAYNIYETSDHQYMAVGALEAKFWTEFCHRLDRPDFLAIGHLFGQKGQEAQAQVAEVFKTKTREEWEAVFAHGSCCVTPVLSPSEALARGYLSTRLDSTESVQAGPELGESTLALGHSLNMSTDLLETWLNEGAIR
ncbi:MAG: putative acyl-CoA transferase [Pseudomonadota bacterium]|jgi:crotonobetainyl-CoA:carnitine CoA-transferase CaiB-like acyl-CoA transferase